MRRREVQNTVSSGKKENLPGDPLGNLVGLGIVAPTLHFDCKQPSSEVPAKEPSDRFNVMSEKHPAEGGPQLKISCGPTRLCESGKDPKRMKFESDTKMRERGIAA